MECCRPFHAAHLRGGGEFVTKTLRNASGTFPVMIIDFLPIAERGFHNRFSLEHHNHRRRKQFSMVGGLACLRRSN
jgi:hypothetical protein